VPSVSPHSLLLLLAAVVFAPNSVQARDPNVVVTALANPDYTQRKFHEGATRRETYVVMQGKYYEGATIDKSIERMPFPKIIEYFVPELARREYWPAKALAEADLVLVVHWGTTIPHVSSRELSAKSTQSVTIDPVETAAKWGGLPPPAPAESESISENFVNQIYDLETDLMRERAQQIEESISESIALDHKGTSLAQILGYSRHLRKNAYSPTGTEEERMLRHDLSQERYFIILKAYDLKKKAGKGLRRPEWTMHMNMASPGNNFRIALDQMSTAAVNFFGRTTEDVATVRPGERQGKVTVGTPIIVQEK
jgi:hypothetical protein